MLKLYIFIPVFILICSQTASPMICNNDLDVDLLFCGNTYFYIGVCDSKFVVYIDLYRRDYRLNREDNLMIFNSDGTFKDS